MGHGEEVDLKNYPIREKNIVEKTSKFFYDLIDRPVTWFRGEHIFFSLYNCSLALFLGCLLSLSSSSHTFKRECMVFCDPSPSLNLPAGNETKVYLSMNALALPLKRKEEYTID